MSNKVDFDEYTANYNQLLREHTGFFSANEAYFAQYKVEIVRNILRHPVTRILEFGCGIGRNIRYLQHAFPDAEVVGSDISEASLDIARRENPGVEFVPAIDASASGSADGPGFDLIFVAGVFHHIAIAERIDVAAALLAQLSPQGHLFVFEHNPYNPVTRKIVSNCPYDADAVLLNPGELKRMLTAAGLKVERSAYCLFVPPRFSLLAPLEKVLGWLPLGGQYWVQAMRP